MNYQNRIVVDTNILTYAFDAASPQKEDCLNFLENNSQSIVLTHQVLNEYLRVVTHSKIQKSISIQKAAENVNVFLDRFQVIYPNAATFNKSFEYLLKYKISGNAVFDVYLVATAVTNGITQLATYNVKDFQKFKDEGLDILTL